MYAKRKSLTSTRKCDIAKDGLRTTLRCSSLLVLTCLMCSDVSEISSVPASLGHHTAGKESSMLFPDAPVIPRNWYLTCRIRRTRMPFMSRACWSSPSNRRQRGTTLLYTIATGQERIRFWRNHGNPKNADGFCNEELPSRPVVSYWMRKEKLNYARAQNNGNSNPRSLNSVPTICAGRLECQPWKSIVGFIKAVPSRYASNLSSENGGSRINGM